MNEFLPRPHLDGFFPFFVFASPLHASRLAYAPIQEPQFWCPRFPPVFPVPANFVCFSSGCLSADVDMACSQSSMDLSLLLGVVEVPSTINSPFLPLE